jgi:hypothetical protein
MATVVMEGEEISRKRKRKKTRVIPELFQEHLRVEQVADQATATEQYKLLLSSVKEAREAATVEIHKEPILTPTAEFLFDQRRALKHSQPYSNVQYTLISKQLRIELDIARERRTVNYIERAMAESRSLRKVHYALNVRKKRFHQLEEKNGVVKSTKDGMHQVVKDTFEDIYRSVTNVQFQLKPSDEPFPRFLEREVDSVIQDMRGRTAPGPDRIAIDLIKSAKQQLVPVLTRLFNDCIKEC